MMGTVDMNYLRLFQGVYTHLLVELFLCSVKLGKQTCSLNHMPPHAIFYPSHNDTLNWIAEKNKQINNYVIFTLLIAFFTLKVNFLRQEETLHKFLNVECTSPWLFGHRCGNFISKRAISRLTFNNILHCDCPLCMCVTNESWQIRMQLEIK